MRSAPESSHAPFAQPPAEPNGATPPRRAALRPLFDVDPGWLFILAGLALCVAGVLIPAKRDLFHLRVQLDSLRERERLGNDRLRLHARFLVDLDEADPALTRRLAASQLNVVPAGDVPVILASASTAALTDWIDARAARSSTELPRGRTEWPDTTLTRLATGPQRLWLLGGGVLAVFVGLMLGPSARAYRRASTDEPATVPVTNDNDATVQRSESLALELAVEDEGEELSDAFALACDDDEALAADEAVDVALEDVVEGVATGDATDDAADDAQEEVEDDAEDEAAEAPLEPLAPIESPAVGDAGNEESGETCDSLEYDANAERAANNEIVCEIITAREFAAVAEVVSPAGSAPGASHAAAEPLIGSPGSAGRTDPRSAAD